MHSSGNINAPFIARTVSTLIITTTVSLKSQLFYQEPDLSSMKSPANIEAVHLFNHLKCTCATFRMEFHVGDLDMNYECLKLN